MNMRLVSIDLLRGIAIIAMVQVHVWQYYFVAGKGIGRMLGLWIIGPLGGYAAPLFTLISGVSASLALRAAMAYHFELRVFIQRGGLLFGFATLVSTISGPLLGLTDDTALNWSVVQLVGLCLGLAPLFHRLPVQLQTGLVIIPVLLSELHHTSPLLPSALVDGFAPPLPWLSLYFVGMLAGKGYVHVITSDKEQNWLWFGLIGAALVIPIGSTLHMLYQPFVWQHVANPTPTTLIVFTGFLLILMAICGYYFDHQHTTSPITKIVMALGRRALTIYYLQLVIIVLPVVAYHAFNNNRPQLEWIWFFPMLCGTLGLLHLTVNHLWAYYGHVLTLEWLLATLVRGKSQNASSP